MMCTALLTLATYLPAMAVHGTEAPLQCTVRSIHDGDSMRVQCPGQHRSIAVRMEQIDAPELDQAYGRKARDHLRQICPRGSIATLHSEGRDQYGRLLANVYCDGTSVNESMVSSGAAWAYRRYVKDQNLNRLQQQAQRDRRGLWAGKNPQPPWQWRYQRHNSN